MLQSHASVVEPTLAYLELAHVPTFSIFVSASEAFTREPHVAVSYNTDVADVPLVLYSSPDRLTARASTT